MYIDVLMLLHVFRQLTKNWNLVTKKKKKAEEKQLLQIGEKKSPKENLAILQ